MSKAGRDLPVSGPDVVMDALESWLDDNWDPARPLRGLVGTFGTSRLGSTRLA